MKLKALKKTDWVIAATAVLSAFLNTMNIWKNMDANGYYTAAVTSMLSNFHAFFFASFDPAGFVTIDKPPVAFWVQSAFAAVFGVHGWSVILPEALAGVGSVILLYFMIKPVFGVNAARLTSLIMACTPGAVAVSRTNNIDSLLVFTLLLAAWALLKGVREERNGWIIAAFAIVGLGFNMKMLQAYLVVPAFYLYYLIADRVDWKKKLTVGLAATVILIGVSASWALIVDSISPDKRPYVGGSKTNSVIELAFQYNGISRLMGQQWNGGDGGPGNSRALPKVDTRKDNTMNRNNMPPMPTNSAVSNKNIGQNRIAQPGGFPPGGGFPGGFNQAGGPPSDGGNGVRPGAPPAGNQRVGGAFGTGQPGPWRLFQSELAGQISWLLPLALIGCAALLAGMRRKSPLSAKHRETLFWLAWLVPGIVFFSIAGFYHHYYLIMLAPPIAVLVGAGWTELARWYRENEGWHRWLLPSVLAVAAGFESYMLYAFQSQIGLLWAAPMAAGILIAAVLILARQKEKITVIAQVLGILTLLGAPFYWSLTPMLNGDNSVMPQAGLQSQAGPGGPSGGMPGGVMPGQPWNPNKGPADGSQIKGNGQMKAQDKRTGQDVSHANQASGVNQKLLDYVTRHNTGETYLFAANDSHTAAPYIIKTGKAVMAMGGFSGNDQILNVEKLKKMVKAGQVKFFYVSGGGPGGGSDSAVTDWIIANSVEIPSAEYQENIDDQRGPDKGQGGGPGGVSKLYEIKDYR